MTRPGDPPPHPQPHDAAPASPATVLDRVRPTVVRRRVYEPPPTAPGAGAAHAGATHVMRGDNTDDDENGPPSSVNVARALASLRVDELRRLEEIVSADDDPPVPSVRAVPVASAVPTLRMGPSMALPELASSMGVADEDLVTALVTHGFFSVTATSVLTRETGRAAAGMFGWTVVDDDTLVPRAPRSAKKAKKDPAPAAKAAAKAAVPASNPSPASSKAKPAAKRTGRRGG